MQNQTLLQSCCVAKPLLYHYWRCCRRTFLAAGDMLIVVSLVLALIQEVKRKRHIHVTRTICHRLLAANQTLHWVRFQGCTVAKMDMNGIAYWQQVPRAADQQIDLQPHTDSRMNAAQDVHSNTHHLGLLLNGFRLLPPGTESGRRMRRASRQPTSRQHRTRLPASPPRMLPSSSAAAPWRGLCHEHRPSWPRPLR